VNAAGQCRLVLVRHGETDWNATGRWQGHSGAGLSRRGAEQAEVTASWLHSTFDRVVLVARSDLQRVVETAEPIEQRLDAAVQVDVRLRELDCGSWAGMTHDEIARADPERYAAWQRGEDVAPGGGERVAEMQVRVTEALRSSFGALDDGETAVVVTHGGPIRVGVAGVLGRQVTRLDDACEPVGNCSATVLTRTDAGMRVERYGDCAHLDGLASDVPAGGPL
jgi:glucosyl-3-phosphoglycerate phosphatase